MTVPSAYVWLDSVSPQGDRVTTMEVTMHRFVLAEFNTHRMFSRNSASSRAIPVQKMIRRVIEDPALPLSWPAEKKGMQGGEEMDTFANFATLSWWIAARDAALEAAGHLTNIGVHKSVVNRLLEPFTWQTVIVTGTAYAYANFFEQRCHPDAQPEIRAAAEAMAASYNEASPTQLGYGQWHTPLIRDDEEFTGRVARCAVSAARCARVSYLTHDGVRDIEADLELYDKLVTAKPPHLSPLEHVCRPMWYGDKQYGNLAGWHQLRHTAVTE